MTDEEILINIHKPNFESLSDYENFKEKFKILFNTGPRYQPTTQLIVEVDKTIRNTINEVDGFI